MVTLFVLLFAGYSLFIGVVCLLFAGVCVGCLLVIVLPCCADCPECYNVVFRICCLSVR